MTSNAQIKSQFRNMFSKDIEALSNRGYALHSETNRMNNLFRQTNALWKSYGFWDRMNLDLLEKIIEKNKIINSNDKKNTPMSVLTQNK